MIRNILTGAILALAFSVNANALSVSLVGPDSVLPGEQFEIAIIGDFEDQGFIAGGIQVFDRGPDFFGFFYRRSNTRRRFGASGPPLPYRPPPTRRSAAKSGAWDPPGWSFFSPNGERSAVSSGNCGRSPVIPIAIAHSTITMTDPRRGGRRGLVHRVVVSLVRIVFLRSPSCH